MNKRLPTTIGTVGVLSVGDGDIKLSFDRNNPAERIRAARMVRDMLRRGYALLIEVEPGKYQRAIDFKDDICEYVIADLDPEIAAAHDTKEEQDGEQNEAETHGAPAAPAGAAAPAKRKYTKRTIPAESTRAVAVARTAGG